MYFNTQYFKCLRRNNLEAGKGPGDGVEAPLSTGQRACHVFPPPGPYLPTRPHLLSAAMGDEGWEHVYYHLEFVI